MQKVLNLLLYGGLTQAQYLQVKDDIEEDNRKHLIYMSIVGMIPFSILSLVMLNTDKVPLGITYMIITVILLIICLLSIFTAPRVRGLSNINAYIFDFVLLFVGVVATRLSGDEKATVFLPLLIIAAVIFCIRPVFLIGITAISEILFIMTLYDVQTPYTIYMNTVNSLVFTFVGILVGIFMMERDFKRFYLNYHNKFLIERDQLTGAYNRHSYAVDIEEIIRQKKSVTICMFDVNSLKKTNDNLGHAAGDELIIGAADCITDVFENLGKIYRIGGDEFAALLDKPIDNKQELLDTFARRQKNWSGKIVKEISISTGMCAVDNPDSVSIAEAQKTADSRMYEEKAEYYRNNGIERRK